VRTLHGEAIERYRAARVLLEAEPVALPSNGHGDEHEVRQALWLRAAIGECRSHALLDDAATALPLLRRVSAQVPDHADVLALRAAALAAGDDAASRDEARTALLRLLRHDVESAALLHFAGDVAVRLHDESLALGFYRRALARDPMRPTPRVAIARLLRERGDLLAARLELVAALASAPKWREATVELAKVHKEAKRYGDARQVLADHLLRVPTDLEALSLLAEVLVAEARVDDARVAVDRVLRYDADHGAALWLDGLLLTEQSRLRDAVARWSRLSRLADAEPWSSRARAALARVPRTGDLSTADAIFDVTIFDQALDAGVPQPTPANASVA